MIKVLNPEWYVAESDNLLKHGLVIYDGCWYKINKYDEAEPITNEAYSLVERNPWISDGKPSKLFSPPIFLALSPSIVGRDFIDQQRKLIRTVKAEYEREPLQALTSMLQKLGSAERVEKRWRRGDVRFKGGSNMNPKEIFGLYLKLMDENNIPLDWSM